MLAPLKKSEITRGPNGNGWPGRWSVGDSAIYLAAHWSIYPSGASVLRNHKSISIRCVAAEQKGFGGRQKRFYHQPWAVLHRGGGVNRRTEKILVWKSYCGNPKPELEKIFNRAKLHKKDLYIWNLFLVHEKKDVHIYFCCVYPSYFRYDFQPS